MCQAKVKYTVKVKVGDAPALASYSKLTNGEKSSVPLTKAAVKVKITGACTPEQIDDPSVPLKECHVLYVYFAKICTNNLVSDWFRQTYFVH